MPQVSSIEPGPDTFRILLTTDNHVGYMENDPIRGDDSWKTFDEIMRLALERDVDMVVQGGDLFHVSHPSKKSMYHVMCTLRECCWNEKPIEYRLVSDPSNAMATRHFGYPAEYDPNVNVGLPVYAISGNHDDSTGEELLSPLDLLSVSALLNHFGRVTNNDEIKIYPLLFNKGSTNLALYGLQNVREERLKRTMASGNLEFMQPDTDSSVQWFNLMCVHQNHVPRPGVRTLEEVNLPAFLDFILWGHEHDCVPHAIRNPGGGFSVLQGGSSVATSLTEGEVSEKHVYVLSVKGKDFSLEAIPLKSVRPFTMRSVVLADTGLSATSSNKSDVLNYLIDQVESLITEATDKWKENNRDGLESEELSEADIPLPLVRLRVEYSGGYEVENPRYFSNRFVGKVANVNDVLTLYRKKSTAHQMMTRIAKENRREGAANGIVQADEGEPAGDQDIFGMIEKELDDNELILVRKDEFSNTLTDLISKDDKNVLSSFVKSEEKKTLGALKKLNLEDEDDGAQNVRDLKRGFQKVAKQIRAEAEFKRAPTPVSSAAPVANHVSVSTSTGTTRRRPQAEEPEEIVSDEPMSYEEEEEAPKKQAPKRVPKRVPKRTREDELPGGLAPSVFSGFGKKR